MIWVAFIILIIDVLLQTVFRGFVPGLGNRGISFGLGQGTGNILAVVTFGLLVMWFLYEVSKHKIVNFAIELIVLGAIGNIASRFISGSVWDYICLPFLPFCFNLSDVLISLGVVSYILGVNGNRSSLRGQRDTGH